MRVTVVLKKINRLIICTGLRMWLQHHHTFDAAFVDAGNFLVEQWDTTECETFTQRELLVWYVVIIVTLASF